MARYGQYGPLCSLIWQSMAEYDLVWSHIANYGRVKSSMAEYVRIKTTVADCILLCPLVARYGRICPYMAGMYEYVPVRTIFTLTVPNSALLAHAWLYWASRYRLYSPTFSPIWPCLSTMFFPSLMNRLSSYYLSRIKNFSRVHYVSRHTRRIATARELLALFMFVFRFFSECNFQRSRSFFFETTFLTSLHFLPSDSILFFFLFIPRYLCVSLRIYYVS